MHKYFIVLLKVWLISASKPTDEEVQVKNRSPLLLAINNKVHYNFPEKARITSDQKQEFYHTKKKDARFFCPTETEMVEEAKNKDEQKEENAKVKKRKSSKKQNTDYCLTEKQFGKEEKKNCKSEVKPAIIEQQFYSQHAPCGETGYWYKYVYKVCVYKSVKRTILNIFQFEREPSLEIFYPLLYEICYDHSSNRVLFTKHKIRSRNILRNVNLEEERALHEFPEKYSTESYGLEKLENLPNILQAYKNQNKNSRNKQLLQMLVPIEDFALGHWMKSTFHIMNYGLMHKSKVPIWEAINSHVTDRLLRLKIEGIRIYTGTYGQQVNDRKRKLYLGDDENAHITIPTIWWKVLFTAQLKQGLVIIMHNVANLKKICDEEEIIVKKRKKEKKEKEKEDEDKDKEEEEKEKEKEAEAACDLTKWTTGKLKDRHFDDVYCCQLSSARTVLNILKKEINLKYDLLKLD